MRLHIVRFSATALPAVILAPAFAWAADLDAASHIDAVTVYPDAASITRVSEVELPAGATTLLFKSLPMGIDPNSLRVEASGNGQVAIGSVDLRPSPVTNRAENSIEARLRALHSDREAWQTTLDALEAKKAMILRYSQSGPEKLSADAKPLEIGQWQTAWDTVGQALAKIGDELRSARGKAREIDEDIQALERSKQRPAAEPTRDAVVQIEAATAGKISARLTYRIAAASWQPVYDAKLETADASGKPKLELVRRAAVTQRTGEDWTGVSLSVSTVRARRGTSAPDLPTEQLAFREPPRPLPMGAAPSAPTGAPLSRATGESGKTDAMPARESEALVENGAYQATYRIPGRIDLSADGAVKTLRISTSDFTPDLLVKTTPALDEAAYLQASVTNSADAPLLPGAVNLTRDGVYVGSGRIPLVAPGESADLGFGADDGVKVTRVPVRRKENEPAWYGQTKTQQREYRTTVKNAHPFKVTVRLVDRIPISETSAITVEPLPAPATTPPSEKNVQDRRGVMAWVFDLDPGESKEIRLGYRVKWPADRDLISLPASAGPR